MDVYCPKRGCNEPVDQDYFHDVADMNETSYREVARDFQQRGCEALGETHNVGNDDGRGEVMSAMFDLLGDDIDGAAAMMEDFEYMGAFE